MTNLKIDPAKIAKMFKAYDLRGTVPDLSAKIYYWSGIAFVEEILKPQYLPLEVNICHDCRYSSQEFYAALYQGLSAAGVKVNCLGMLSTDLMYASSLLNNRAAMIVTASHNPKDDNGLKIVKSGSEMLGLENGLDKVRDFVLQKLDQNIVELTQNYPATDEQLRRQVLDFYKQKVLQIGKVEELNKLLQAQNRRLKIVVDCGNGMGGLVMNLVKDLFVNIDWVELYWQPDGNFPNHPADPSQPQNLIDLQWEILRQEADLGVATDGDADRCYFLDENGQSINGNFLGATMSQFMLDLYHNSQHTDNKNPAVVYNFSASRCVPTSILQNGGAAIPSPMGHTFIKKTMHKYQAWYGLEHSMHHYYGAFGNFENTAITLSLVLFILVSQQQKPSQINQHFDTEYFLSGEINFRLTEQLTMEYIRQQIKVNFEQATISYLDGISVFYPSWQFSLRFSNTEPLLRLNVETIGKDEVKAKVEQIKQILGLN